MEFKALWITQEKKPSMHSSIYLFNFKVLPQNHRHILVGMDLQWSLVLWLEQSRARPSCSGLVQSNSEHLQGQRCHLLPGPLLQSLACSLGIFFLAFSWNFPCFNLGLLPLILSKTSLTLSSMHPPSRLLWTVTDRASLSPSLLQAEQALLPPGISHAPAPHLGGNDKTMSFLYREDQNWTQCFRCCFSWCCGEGKNRSPWSAAPASSAQDVALKIRQLTENYMYGKLYL